MKSAAILDLLFYRLTQCGAITGTGNGYSAIFYHSTRLCNRFMEAAILEQQEQLAYKESFPTTVHQGSLLWPYELVSCIFTGYLSSSRLYRTARQMPASIAKSEGSNESVHRCSRIRMTSFILIKLMELPGKNSNDERTSMYRYIGVINLHWYQFWLNWRWLLLGSSAHEGKFLFWSPTKIVPFIILNFTVSVPSTRLMSALLDFKLALEYALMHVCHVVESKCIFVWTILSQ